MKYTFLFSLFGGILTALICGGTPLESYKNFVIFILVISPIALAGVFLDIEK